MYDHHLFTLGWDKIENIPRRNWDSVRWEPKQCTYLERSREATIPDCKHQGGPKVRFALSLLSNHQLISWISEWQLEPWTALLASSRTLTSNSENGSSQKAPQSPCPATGCTTTPAFSRNHTSFYQRDGSVTQRSWRGWIITLFLSHGAQGIVWPKSRFFTSHQNKFGNILIWAGIIVLSTCKCITR